MHKTMRHHRCARCSARRAAALALAASALWPGVGCGTGHRWHFNPYAPNNGDPTVLQRVQGAVDAADKALDNLDQLQENMVY
jgi:hypothetical protein